jgi:hypothetical protein
MRSGYGEGNMPYDLATLKLSETTQLGMKLRSTGTGAASIEEVASRTVHLLHDELVEISSGRPATALVRLYLTVPYGELDDDLRRFGARLMPGEILAPTTRCLTLLGTVGDRPEWSDRQRSVGHRAIPLPSEAVVQSIPMISQLLRQLGLDVATVVTPAPTVVLEVEQRTYNVFYVPEAVGSAHIPAQEDFVVPCGIRSVLGFGGLLPSGEVFATLVFTRVSVPRDVADMFRNLAMNLKLALLPVLGRPIFDQTGSSSGR